MASSPVDPIRRDSRDSRDPAPPDAKPAAADSAALPALPAVRTDTDPEDSRHSGFESFRPPPVRDIGGPEDFRDGPHGGPADESTAGDLGRFGHYQIMCFLAKGGMGAVFKALDTHSGRTVALKVPSEQRLNDRLELERFHREAALAKLLVHPNICPMIEVGRHRGRPYITLEYVDGLPLRKWVNRRRPTLEGVSRVVAVLARAVHYAHGRGVIHRDVKPENIMVRGGGSAADGHGGEGVADQPVLLDFGLARHVDDDTQLTRQGICVGTPAYMAPEQAFGWVGPTPKADVYSLGAVLYELLTGHPPYRGQPIEVLAQLRDEAPRTPRTLNPDIPEDLEAVVLRAMARDMEERFPSADALADAIEACLGGPAVPAMPEPPPPPVAAVAAVGTVDAAGSQPSASSAAGAAPDSNDTVADAPPLAAETASAVVGGPASAAAAPPSSRPSDMATAVRAAILTILVGGALIAVGALAWRQFGG